MFTPCAMDATAVYRELQTCIGALESGTKADVIREKMSALQLKIPADDSLGLLLGFAEKNLTEMTQEVALEQLKNLSVLIACTYRILPEPQAPCFHREFTAPCFPPAIAKPLPAPPSPSRMSDSELELLREQVEKVKKEKAVVRSRCLVVIQLTQENDAIINTLTRAIDLSQDQLKNKMQMLNRAKLAVRLVQTRFDAHDKLLAKRKEDLKTLVMKRPSPFSLINPAYARCVTKLQESLILARRISVQFPIPKWSEWDPSKGVARYSAGNPKRAWGLEWWLKIEKHADGIGAYICVGNLQDGKELVVNYQLSVKHRITEKSITPSPLYRTIFGKDKAWGKAEFTTFTKVAAEGGYTRAEDTITFLCTVDLIKGAMWGRREQIDDTPPL